MCKECKKESRGLVVIVWGTLFFIIGTLIGAGFIAGLIVGRQM